MNPQDFDHKTEPHVLVEGPRWGDAEFYSKWLLAAAKADVLWKKAITDDPSFKKQVEAVTAYCIPDFRIAATVMLSRFEENLASIMVGLTEDDWLEFNEVAMMAEMGFFVITGARYQMVLPRNLNSANVKRAVLKFARTEDEDGVLRPERLLTTMPYAQARAWQTRLRQMDENRRCDHRRRLLELTISRQIDESRRRGLSK
jgi:hypothetical protein